MKRRIRRNLAKRQREIHLRLAVAWSNDLSTPSLPTTGSMYELGERNRAIAHGGIGLIQRLVGRLGLARAINDKVRLLKLHLPYHESDHVLNIAFNVLCGGRTLDDIELRRNDAAYLDALGVDAIPDPTTRNSRAQAEHAQDRKNSRTRMGVESIGPRGGKEPLGFAPDWAGLKLKSRTTPNSKPRSIHRRRPMNGGRSPVSHGYMPCICFYQRTCLASTYNLLMGQLHLPGGGIARCSDE